MRVLYPSQDFAAPPAFTLDIPDDWTGRADAFADMVVVAPRPTERIHENVVVKYRRVNPELDGEAVLDEMLREVADDPTNEVRSVVKRQTAEGPLARTLSTRTIDETEVFQDHALMHLRSGRSCFVLTVTATAADTEAGAERAGALVESLRVQPASSDDE